jgi:hypothetical protein
MNERIKQLALECYNPYGNFDHEKFAELIINECITAIDNTNKSHVYTTFDQDMVGSTIKKSKQAIKEHFGL